MTLLGDDGTTQPPRVVLLYWGSKGGGSLFTRYFAEDIRVRLPGATISVSLRRGNLDRPSFSGLPTLEVDIVSPVSAVRHPVAAWNALSAHLEEIRSLAPDLVIVTMNSPLAWPIVWRLRRAGLRIAYVAHDARPHPGDYARTIQRFAHASFLRWADSVVALSEHVGHSLRRQLGGRGDLRVIPLEAVVPVRRTVAVPAPRPGEPVRLLFLGRLLAYKGLDDLTEALGPLRCREGWRLTIAGHGPMEAALRERFAAWPQVTLKLGWLSDEALEAELASHHLLLCPYTEASQSGVVALGLAWALPSLVTPHGALPEQIGHGEAGLVLRGSSPAYLTAALLQVIDDPNELARLSAGALALMERRRTDTGWRNLVLDAHRDGLPRRS